MDVDTPNLLKRCSSAPLINEASSTTATSPTTSTAPRNAAYFSMFSNNQPRTRRSSYHFSSWVTPQVNLNNSWGAASTRRPHRVTQLRVEECANVSNTREVAHERDLHTAMQMGRSCEDITLLGGPSNSPTRIPRFSSVVSPSPPRKYTTRRSLSPIPLRPATLSPISRQSNLVTKRRCDEADSPLSKRMCTDRHTPSTPGTPDSDSLECTFRPVSPRPQPMNESPQNSQDVPINHKCPNPS